MTGVCQTHVTKRSVTSHNFNVPTSFCAHRQVLNYPTRVFTRLAERWRCLCIRNAGTVVSDQPLYFDKRIIDRKRRHSAVHAFFFVCALFQLKEARTYIVDGNSK